MDQAPPEPRPRVCNRRLHIGAARAGRHHRWLLPGKGRRSGDERAGAVIGLGERTVWVGVDARDVDVGGSEVPDLQRGEIWRWRLSGDANSLILEIFNSSLPASSRNA